MAAPTDSRAGRAADRRLMRRCLELARRAEGRTAPNPIVGCVIVGPDGRVLAEAWHERAGAPHAEAAALAKLGGRAEGASLYVSLEPCAHTTARRTAPCAPLVVGAGIRRLVYGMRDPFPGHGGLAAIAAAGIEVVGPVEEEACERANAPFITFVRRGRPHFTLKAAMTLDGRIATARGEARWISGEAARADSHQRRDRVDAILVGAGTVVSDDPLLTTRGVPDGRDPVRIVLDGRLRTPAAARLLHSGSPAPTLIVTTTEAPEDRAAALAAAGAEIVRLPGGPGAPGAVDPGALAAELGRRGILSVLVEGGGQTHAGLLAAGLCDRLLLYVAPLAIGGAGAPGWLGGGGAPTLAEAPRFTLDAAPRRVGEDLLLELVPVRPGPQGYSVST